MQKQYTSHLSKTDRKQLEADISNYVSLVMDNVG